MTKEEAPIYSVALLSAAALAYEVLLIRLFSIIQWHHFAYMVISLALLGFGASGTFLALTRNRIANHFFRFFASQLILFGISSLICYLIAQKISFHPEELLWDWRQWIRLPGMYLLLGLPFFFAANAIGAALSSFTFRIARTYAADLMGAGVGSLIIILLLHSFFPESILKVICCMGLGAAVVATWELKVKPGIPVVIAAVAAAVILVLPSGWIHLSVSPYKGLSQLLAISGTEVTEKRSGPLGLLTIVRSSSVPLRYAPGLSLNAISEPPSQIAIFTDADAMTVITKFQGNREQIRYLDYLTSALPFHLQPVKSALILGAGGGSDVLQARFHNVPQIDAVELNPQIVALMKTTYADFSGQIYNSSGTHVHVAEARGFIETHERQYDLVQLAIPGSFGASAAGLYALNENYLLTTEAIQSYLRRLEPNGFLSITGWIKIPPRETFKIFATAVEALRRIKVAQPDQRIILIRGWQTATLVIKNGVITRDEINRLHKFCSERSFDVAFYPGMQSGEANRYNLLQSPTLFFDAAQALLGKNAETFFQSYKFQIQPATDDRPYFFHFFKWSVLPELLSLFKRGGISLLESGYLVLIAAFVQALFFGLIFIVLPLWVVGAGLRPARVENRKQKLSFRFVCFFSALGFAFFFVEVAFIQKFMLFLHHPIFAITISLSAFLLSAGAGSAVSKSWVARKGQAFTLRAAVIGIVLIASLQLLTLSPIFEFFSETSGIVKIVIAVFLIAPLGFFMGMPFPVGMASLTDGVQVSWAWALNGYSSVLSAIVATVIAIHFGFVALILIALLLYATAAVLFPVAPSSKKS